MLLQSKEEARGPLSVSCQAESFRYAVWFSEGESRDSIRSMKRPLVDYFRFPDEFANLEVNGELSIESGFFQFGSNITCYGRCSSVPPSPALAQHLCDASYGVRDERPPLALPFDLSEVVNNLRNERYVSCFQSQKRGITDSAAVRKAYYLFRPLLSVSLRKHLQRAHLQGWKDIPFPSWPVDFTVETLMERLMILILKSHKVEQIPFIWFWPEGAPACAMMTHDVEGIKGRDYCGELMNLDDSFGIKSAFQIVPEERYKMRNGFLDALRAREFEINVHDLNHDGSLFREREKFLQWVRKINMYAKEFGATGFRSGAMYRNQEWFDSFDFSYDMSVPNVAHLEPQQGGCCTVMPYFIGKILELPLTTIQDYSLLHILGDYSIDLWLQQINLIMERHGLISFITHPDYLVDKCARKVYEDLLSHLVRLRDEKKVWIALPGDVNRWWRARSQMHIVCEDGRWSIKGPSSGRARIAFAMLEKDRLKYAVAKEPNPLCLA
jgi:hypothetical protein